MVTVRVDDAVLDALGVTSDERPIAAPALAATGLAATGSSERWSQLQQLRQGQRDPQPLVEALANGGLAPEPDLLAALWGRLDRAAVERLLSSQAASSVAPWQEASRQELPTLADQPAVEGAWLEPLLDHQQQAPSDQQLGWLEVLAPFRDPRVAQRLRRVVLTSSRSRPGSGESLTTEPGESWTMEEVLPLLPLLGRQRQRQDGVLLLQCSLDPGPLAWRQAALEGVALGLSAWPLALLTPALLRLAGDLSPALAGQAVDLLARLPDGQKELRRLVSRPLDTEVSERLRRRRCTTPLLLLIHGRQGGAIPAVYEQLARELEERRRSPVLLQALTGSAPATDQRLWQAVIRGGGLTLVPLLLLPGDHVRHDLPAITDHWRTDLADNTPGAEGLTLRRVPFLGAWPDWQRLLAQQLGQQAGGGPWIWVHHPLQGPLAGRYLRHLEQVLGAEGRPAADASGSHPAAEIEEEPLLRIPLSLAPSRITESLRMDGATPLTRVPPPLLEQPAVRECLLSQLEALP